MHTQEFNYTAASVDQALSDTMRYWGVIRLQELDKKEIKERTHAIFGSLIDAKPGLSGPAHGPKIRPN